MPHFGVVTGTTPSDGDMIFWFRPIKILVEHEFL